jgi:aldehyde dehydrogenase (NAD+)/betaine-aldehyde dehydrogenase
MTVEADRLAAEYFNRGTLADLPNGHFIDGRWMPAIRGRQMETFDPGQGRAYHSFAAGDVEDIASAVEAAKRAAAAWAKMRPSARGAILSRASALLREAAPQLAAIESLDSGKPLQEAEGDVAGAARAFEYYAAAANTLQGDSFPLGHDYLGYSRQEPAGLTGHIIPWNYPLSTAARGIAPALAAGCTVIAKPAEQTPMTALKLAELLHRAGLPAGVCNVVTGTGAEAGAALVRHPAIRHISFTGSVQTGINVMREAAPNVTRVLLELGGKSPIVVLADADIDAAVEGIMGAIFENAGQICSAGSRLVVDRRIHEALVDRLVRRARTLKVGHGLRRPDFGPLNSAEHLARVAAHVDGARARGLSIVTGGHATCDPESGKGWFFEPTIIDAVPQDDPAVQQEIFGPVLVVQPFDQEEEALALANGTDYGLVAGIYTRDFSAAHRLARDIDAGQVFVNEYFAGGIEVPFGGNKMSGFGREKGLAALEAYSRVKSIAARIGA